MLNLCNKHSCPAKGVITEVPSKETSAADEDKETLTDSNHGSLFLPPHHSLTASVNGMRDALPGEWLVTYCYSVWNA